ncbi:hypothetical protein OKW22_001166 [Bacilli bacterium PM5-3]|nr:hypothetical protein [Bacilli bacterium PM5-3]MDH6604335.1 hypothetical protein [Bacilli bacterium PM5-9]
MHRYFCVDESGSFNTSYEQYYIISGIIVEDNSILQNIHKKIEKEVRTSKNSIKELKASRIKDEKKALFINEMLDNSNIKIISLVIDKKELNNKYDFIISEFLIYNYALKELCKAALENNLIMKNDEILFFVDARSMNQKVYNDLESYLNLEFFDILKKVNVVYKDSSITREIQMADYVSNVIYGYYNKTNRAYEHIKKIKNIPIKLIP